MIPREAFSSSRPVRRWLDAMPLVDGFALFILISPAPLETRLCIEEMRRELKLEQDEVRLIEPYTGFESTTDGLSTVSLQEQVLAPLISPRSSARAILLDLGNVDRIDQIYRRDRLMWLFGRMNEQRNTMTQANPCPLVLVVDQTMEQELIRGAPDVWSVRSGDFVIETIERPRAIEWRRGSYELLQEASTLLVRNWTSPEAQAAFAHALQRLDDGVQSEAEVILQSALISLPDATRPTVRAPFTLAALILEAEREGWAGIEERFCELAEHWMRVPFRGEDTDDAEQLLTPAVLWLCGMVAGAAGSLPWSLRCFDCAMGWQFGSWAGGILFTQLQTLQRRLVPAGLANIEQGRMEVARWTASWLFHVMSSDWYTSDSTIRPAPPPSARFHEVADLMALLGDERREAWLRERAHARQQASPSA